MTQTKFEFLIQTLELYGLPEDYMKGVGHHNDWTKDANEKKKKGAGAKAKGKPKHNFASMQKKLGITKEVVKRPTFFDLRPIKEALRRFLHNNSEERTKMRTLFLEKSQQVRNSFKDQHGEVSFKKVMDVHELPKILVDNGIPLDKDMQETLGSMMICFGDIEVDEGWGNRIPEDTEQMKRDKIILDMELTNKRKEEEDRKKKEKTGLYKPPTEEEEQKQKEMEEERDKKIADLMKSTRPRPPIKKWLRETSIHDFLIALDRMAEYDRMLSDLGLMNEPNWLNEDRILKKLGREYVKEHVELPELPAEQEYSKDAEIQKIVENIND